MAKKKYYLVDKFETKEDFEKRFDSIYNSGYAQGHKDGMIEAVSYMFEMIDHFDLSCQRNAEKMNSDRQKKIAMKNHELGITPYVPDDPATKERMKEYNRRIEAYKMFFNKSEKEDGP